VLAGTSQGHSCGSQIRPVSARSFYGLNATTGDELTLTESMDASSDLIRACVSLLTMAACPGGYRGRR
jgi:hypothetical protein